MNATWIQKLGMLLTSTLVIMSMATDVWAQANTTTRPTSGADTGLDNIRDEEFKKMSPQERLKESGKSIEKIRGSLELGDGVLKKARESQDILMINCVNSNLALIKGFLKVAEQAGRELQSAANRGGNTEKEQVHQIKLVKLAEARAQTYADKMLACAGETSQYTGPTRTTPEIDPDVRQDNPADNPDLVDVTDIITTDQLPEASPFQ